MYNASCHLITRIGDHRLWDDDVRQLVEDRVRFTLEHLHVRLQSIVCSTSQDSNRITLEITVYICGTCVQKIGATHTWMLGAICRVFDQMRLLRPLIGY